MLLSDLLDTIEEKKTAGPIEIEVTGLAYDSRAVEDGNAFFCIKGLVTDGHLFAAQAVERGATVLFVEREPEVEIPGDVAIVRVPDTRFAMANLAAKFYKDPSEELRLVGVTGTNGKTTTCYLVESILKEAGYTAGLIGTVENHIGETVESVTRTTPESLDLQRLLRRMVDEGVEAAVMEVSSHALELHRVGGCRFDVVAFTNLTQDHLDFHISLEEYFGAKRRLFEGDDYGASRSAVINVDDEFGKRLMRETTLPSRSFGLDPGADVRAADVAVSARGNSFELIYGETVKKLSTRLQGRFNVYNCLTAAAVGVELELDGESIERGLESLEGVPGRFENIDCGQPFTALVDYAHTPDGIRNVLEACREVTDGRVIIVVGCGGDRDRSKRPLMGGVATRMADLCIITSDNPRSEDPASVIDMVLEGVRGEFSADRYAVEVDRRAAICRAVEEANDGDLVVVAGKGHESGQIFADRVIPFDDRQVLRECLREVRGAECQP
ncbi:MAG: UDP-N-acetylmuramoyl-L-alanyl-D-glutamate--2,6-diaminopimelate ligase [Candidatus Geothermincolia bacterium]